MFAYFIVRQRWRREEEETRLMYKFVENIIGRLSGFVTCKNLWCQIKVPYQGPTLRLTGGQCDQKLSVGDQKFRTGRQQATNLLSPRHLKFQGKWSFFKRKHKAAVENCSKTKRRFYDRHNYPAPYCFIAFSQF